MKIRSLAIFCGSKAGNSSIYGEQAVALGELLAARNVSVVYGGGKNGLMGAVADSAMAVGGDVRGIIPQLLVNWESQHDAISELVVVEDMHIRKRTIYERCDGAIILPGGFGTLDELFEMLTWNQLAIHDKQIFLLNSGGFYDHLLAHLQKLSDEGFLYSPVEEALTVLDRPEDLEPYLG